MEFEYSLHYGTVIDNDDTNHPDGKKLSRVQVKIWPEMKNFKNEHLPWAYPFLSDGLSNNQFNHEPPEIDSHVWIFSFENTFKDLYYLKGSFINNLFNITDVENKLNSISEITPEEYPNMRFKYLPDGSIIFYGKNGNVGIYHKTGAYLVIDKDGKIIINSINDITVKTTANFTLEGTSSITLKTPDSAIWQPNIIGNCLFTGAPHGGSVGGISLLKGS